MAIVGGLSQQKQERLLRNCPSILVATPGRLWSMMENLDKNDHFLTDLSHLEFLIIDEADRMLESGHFEELTVILDRIRQQSSAKLQRMVFSATLTYVHPGGKDNGQHAVAAAADDAAADGLAKLNRFIDTVGLRKQRKIFDLTRRHGSMVETLVETRLNCTNLVDKDTNVYYLLCKYQGRTLIFANSIDAVRRLHALLTKFHLKPMVLHARMHQKQRLKNLEKFAATPNSLLLATDVAARGLDIRGIEHVIHYQVPKTVQVPSACRQCCQFFNVPPHIDIQLYIHRSGRTARASSTGLTVMLVDAKDAHYYRRICHNLGRTDLPVFPIDSEQLRTVLKIRISLASEVESIEHRITKRVSRENWFEKSARDAELEWDSGKNADDGMKGEIDDLKRKKKQLRSRLSRLLMEPLPKNRQNVSKTRYPTFEMAQNYTKSISEAVEVVKIKQENEKLFKKSRHLTAGRMMVKVRDKKKKKNKKKKRK